MITVDKAFNNFFLDNFPNKIFKNVCTIKKNVVKFNQKSIFG